MTAELRLREERRRIERRGRDVVGLVLAEATDRRRARELHRELLVLRERDPERARDLFFRRRALQLVLELRGRA